MCKTAVSFFENGLAKLESELTGSFGYSIPKLIDFDTNEYWVGGLGNVFEVSVSAMKGFY